MYAQTILNGNTLLIIALLVSFLSLFFLARSASGNAFSLVTSRQLYYLTSILIILASILLMGSLLTNDFQNAYVYSNSSHDLPVIYRIAAFWAGTQGSFLLWLLILNIFGVVITRVRDEHENILMSLIVITQIFFLIVLFIDSPFKPLWQVFQDVEQGFKPRDGSGMNPLLIDPWMVSHPPVLFMGYASALIPFGYAIAALLKKDASLLLNRSFPWVLFSALSLGVGIFMGGYWSYKVLGWGGYWGWDPVENSSLIPWLIVITLIHGLILQRRRGALIRINIFLSLLYFILVFYSTFLTRSGVLSDFSVHSFTDYGLAGYFIFFILFYIIIAAFLFIKQFKSFAGGSLNDSMYSWDSLTGYGVIVLAIYATIILFGTSMPILSRIFTDNPTAVTVKFYNNLSVPFGLLILVFMISSTMAMTAQRLLSKRVIITAVISLVLGVLFNIAFTTRIEPYIFTVASLFVIINCSYDLYTVKSTSIIASRITHMGTAFLIIGVMASGFHSWSEQKKLHMNETVEIGPIALTFKGLKEDGKSTLLFSMTRGSTTTDFETDYYFDNKTQSWYRTPYISHGIFGDTYITPLAYHNGIQEATSLLIEKNTTQSIDGLSITFHDFITAGMTSDSPTINAHLTINGKKTTPGIKIAAGNKISLPEQIPGTSRTVTLADLDISNKRIMLHITPGKDTVIPPDSAIVEIAHKRLIWMVWLGTLVITAGIIMAFVRRIRSKRD